MKGIFLCGLHKRSISTPTHHTLEIETNSQEPWFLSSVVTDRCTDLAGTLSIKDVYIMVGPGDNCSSKELKETVKAGTIIPIVDHERL